MRKPPLGYPVGTRVRLTAAGKCALAVYLGTGKRFPEDARGVVATKHRLPHIPVTVKWDHKRQREQVAADFIEPDEQR